MRCDFMLYHIPCVMSHVMCHVTCHMSCVMSSVTCYVSCHVSWHKSSNVKYLATHILLIVLNNYLTILSNVMYPCHKSCTHVTSHVPMSHVMYPCHMSCIHFACHVFMSHSNSHVISFYKSEYWITLDNMQYYKFL